MNTEMLIYRLIGPFNAFWFGLRNRLTRVKSVRMKQVDLPRHGPVTVDVVLDFTGDSCLRTNLLVKKALERAHKDTVLEIASDNLSSVETIPFMLANYNCAHLVTLHQKTCWRIYVRKIEAGMPEGKAPPRRRGMTAKQNVHHNDKDTGK